MYQQTIAEKVSCTGIGLHSGAPTQLTLHPARAGETMFVKHCIACHKIDGGGSSVLGPDLNKPMNPVEYFQPAALRRYLRDPASVRHWPDQKMPGFAPETHDKLFEPYFTTKAQGLGLGLSISRSIVLAHGGRLWGVSTPGRGATFHIALPAVGP